MARRAKARVGQGWVSISSPLTDRGEERFCEGRIDAGPIIRVLQFPVIEGEDNLSLSRRAFSCTLMLYYEVLT